VRALAVPRERLHLHPAGQRGGGQVGVGEAGVEGDHEMQPGGGAVHDRAGEVGPDRGDHRVPATAMAPAQEAKLAFQLTGFHQPGQYQLRQHRVAQVRVPLGSHEGVPVLRRREYPSDPQRRR
jgi:hypothetical protein